MFNPRIQDSPGSSDEEESSSDVSDDDWRKFKRGKHNTRSMDVLTSPSSGPRGADGQSITDTTAKRRNNIWTNLLQDQTLTEGIHTLDVIGHTGSETLVSRQCESYRYVVDQPRDREDRSRRMRRNKRNDRKRRIPVKERLGAKTEDDVSDEMAIAAIVSVLKEPKFDLISKVVEILGKEKALQYMRKTREIEAAGGNLTYDRKRKRTPGGVYFNLLKTDPEVAEDKKQLVFKEDKKKFQYMKRKIRAAERKQKLQKKRAMLAEAEKQKSGDKPLPTVAELALQNAGNASVEMECEREPGELTDSGAEEPAETTAVTTL